MTCPNCGAEMEKHAFAHVCSYCGSMLQTEGCYDVSSYERDTADSYDYITRNISYLSAHPEFISIKKDRSSYSIKCTKEFHPLNNEYRLYCGIGMYWKAIISREDIQLTLVIKGHKSLNHSLAFEIDDSTFILLHGNLQDEYAISYSDFEAICNSEHIVLALNEIYKYDEFRTYSHRFYNFVFDRTKYLYSINQKLLTD